MIVLALDTATEVLSVALCDVEGNSEWCHSVVVDRGLHHTGLLMPAVDQMLTQAEIEYGDIELIACMRGPGSFTGLRIGMATAKGLAEASAAVRAVSAPPLVSLPTLEVMARSVAPTSPVLSVIDGRKRRYYAALAVDGVIGDQVDLPAVEATETLLRGHTETAGRYSAETNRIVVTGPHAAQFVAEYDRAETKGEPRPSLIVDPRSRAGWAVPLARQAPLYLREHGSDPREQGPDYIRISDAEIGITRS
jgi:tRNA threonylcarbamoyladenosine biosynthesis protein TsaB